MWPDDSEWRRMEEDEIQQMDKGQMWRDLETSIESLNFILWAFEN